MLTLNWPGLSWEQHGAQFLHTVFLPQLQTSPEYGQGMNPISRLAQIQQAKKEKEPEYMLLTERGLPRRREFVMQVGVWAGPPSLTTSRLNEFSPGIGSLPEEAGLHRHHEEVLLAVMWQFRHAHWPVPLRWCCVYRRKGWAGGFWVNLFLPYLLGDL